MKREEIVEKKIEWQTEYRVGRRWFLQRIASDEDKERVEKLKSEYENMKNRGQCVRLLKWSKIVKYEVIDGEGF